MDLWARIVLYGMAILGVTCLLVALMMTEAPASECLHSARSVWHHHPGSHATWDHEYGRKCWFARKTRLRWVSLPRPRARYGDDLIRLSQELVAPVPPERPDLEHAHPADPADLGIPVSSPEPSAALSFDETFLAFSPPTQDSERPAELSAKSFYDRLVRLGWSLWLAASLANSRRVRDFLSQVQTRHAGDKESPLPRNIGRGRGESGVGIWSELQPAP